MHRLQRRRHLISALVLSLVATGQLALPNGGAAVRGPRSTIPASAAFTVAAGRAPATMPLAAWVRVRYGGAPLPGGTGRTPGRIPSYSVAYPRTWGARFWPDTLAGYGQLQLQSPAGSAIDLMILPLPAHGPTFAALVAHDTAFLAHATRDRLALPLGAAVRLSGIATPSGAGMASEILYLQRPGVLYRLFATYPVGAPDGAVLGQVAATLQVPTSSGLTIPPPAPTPPLMGGCCRCPAQGTGWGTALTSLDGIPIYSNAGDVDNGCIGTYGILYQCVELVQRYFAQRWGYPDVWSGVYGAADMRAIHPGDIAFVPNGGLPGPREGDAVLFYGGGVGHVALVKGVDPARGQLTLVEENWSPTGEATLPLYGGSTVGIRDSAYGSYVVAGWLHSPRNAARPSS